jgi:hypothetical protein
MVGGVGVIFAKSCLACCGETSNLGGVIVRRGGGGGGGVGVDLRVERTFFWGKGTCFFALSPLRANGVILYATSRR